MPLIPYGGYIPGNAYMPPPGMVNIQIVDMDDDYDSESDEDDDADGE